MGWGNPKHLSRVCVSEPVSLELVWSFFTNICTCSHCQMRVFFQTLARKSMNMSLYSWDQCRKKNTNYRRKFTFFKMHFEYRKSAIKSRDKLQSLGPYRVLHAALTNCRWTCTRDIQEVLIAKMCTVYKVDDKWYSNLLHYSCTSVFTHWLCCLKMKGVAPLNHRPFHKLCNQTNRLSKSVFSTAFLQLSV